MIIYKKIKRGVWGFSSVVERLPSKRKALGSVPSSEKKKKEPKKKKNQKKKKKKKKKKLKKQMVKKKHLLSIK
uniref:hypothetical protein n=1 Tax=Salmonella sp. s58313 TaxID=3160131 RepID=UPI003754AA62